ncbi:MAG: hypothetical protein IJM62_02620 [Lachnospiraceae bacterium]|nr:hypothetical protein [Lachnospiraceae bacterium]
MKIRTERRGSGALRILLCCLLTAVMICMAACGKKDGGEGQESGQGPDQSAAFVITKQPESVTVSYPAGASFTVEVDDADAVGSYQWVMVDIEGNEFVLSGTSACTDTLVLPSTQMRDNDLRFYCIITDKDGNEVRTEQAVLSKDNREENKPVVYICEYAIEPGQTLDLSEVELADGSRLGSGTVTFDENAKDIRVKDLDYDNSKTMADLVCGSNVGLSLDYHMPDVDEYTVTFEGKNRILNTYFNEEYNAGGIPVDFYLTGEVQKPLVTFTGDGTLEIINGYNAIRVIGDLDIDIDITVKQNREVYSDGICAENLKISEGHKLELEVYGAALYAKGNVYIDGAEVSVKAHAPHISMGTATKNVIQGNGSVVIEDSKLDLTADVDPEICSSVGGYSGILAGADLYISGSNVSYSVTAKKGEKVYAASFVGLSADYIDISDDSNINISMDTPEIFNAFGMYSGGSMEINGSTVSVDVHTSGYVYGIAAEGETASIDSDVDVTAAAYDDYGYAEAYGIMAGELRIDYSEAGMKVRSFAEGGMAVGCDPGDRVTEPVEYEEGFESKAIKLEGAVCSTPERNAVAPGSVVEENGDGTRSYLPVETYYDLNDTSKPAEEVIFTAE